MPKEAGSKAIRDFVTIYEWLFTLNMYKKSCLNMIRIKLITFLLEIHYMCLEREIRRNPLIYNFVMQI